MIWQKMRWRKLLNYKKEMFGDTDLSIKNLNKAIDIDPNFTRAILMRAYVYKESANYRKALADTNKVLKLDPEHPYSFWIRGIAKQYIGFYDPCPDLKKACDLGYGCEDHKLWCTE